MSATTIYSRAVFKDDSELNHPDDLAELGAALIERSIAEKHGQVSEHVGAAMGAELVQKLHALSKLEHADSAAGGFAGAIVNVLELGIANLPQRDEGADK